MRDFTTPHSYAGDFKPNQWAQPVSGPPTPTTGPPTPAPKPYLQEHLEQSLHKSHFSDRQPKDWWKFGWDKSEPFHVAGDFYVPHGGRMARQIFTTDTVPQAIKSFYNVIRPIGVNPFTGTFLAPSKEQIALGQTVGQFAYLTTRNPYDQGDYSAYFSDQGQKRNLPMLAQASAEIEKISPWTLRKGYQGTKELARQFQEEPGRTCT